MTAPLPAPPTGASTWDQALGCVHGSGRSLRASALPLHLHVGVDFKKLLEQAGLVETYVDADGKIAMRLTADGERVARQMAMSSEDEQDALLAALVEAAEDDA